MGQEKRLESELRSDGEIEGFGVLAGTLVRGRTCRREHGLAQQLSNNLVYQIKDTVIFNINRFGSNRVFLTLGHGSFVFARFRWPL